MNPTTPVRAIFQSTYGDSGFNTYIVSGQPGYVKVGYVRIVKNRHAPRRAWEISTTGRSEGFSGRFPNRNEAGMALVRQYVRKHSDSDTPPPEDDRNGGTGTPTMVTCSCGHDYRYNIKRASAITWLQGRPCPSCQHGTPQRPKDNDDTLPPVTDEPDSEPEPEPDRTEDIAALLATWPHLPEDGALHSAFVDLMLLLDAGLPVWLQGPPGTGKSTMAEQAAAALGLSFHPVSCHEMMTRTDLFGYRDAVGTDHRTPLWDAFENGGVVLLDEADNGNPNLLAALNSALSNGHCVFGSGTVVRKHDDFRMVATANTAGLGPEAGYVGRNGVDLATRDRFVTLFVGIDPNLEVVLAAAGIGDEDMLHEAEAVAFNAAEAALKDRARTAVVSTVGGLDVARTVGTIRLRVESRFRGTVLSPRCTLHVARMVTRGFSINDAIAAKLVGLTADEVASVLA